MKMSEKIEGLRVAFEESIKGNNYPQTMRNIIRMSIKAKETEDKVDLIRNLEIGKNEATEVMFSTPAGERINITAIKESKTVTYYLEVTYNFELCYENCFSEA